VVSWPPGGLPGLVFKNQNSTSAVRRGLNFSRLQPDLNVFFVTHNGFFTGKIGGPWGIKFFPTAFLSRRILKVVINKRKVASFLLWCPLELQPSCCWRRLCFSSQQNRGSFPESHNSCKYQNENHCWAWSLFILQSVWLFVQRERWWCALSATPSWTHFLEGLRSHQREFKVYERLRLKRTLETVSAQK